MWHVSVLTTPTTRYSSSCRWVICGILRVAFVVHIWNSMILPNFKIFPKHNLLCKYRKEAIKQKSSEKICYAIFLRLIEKHRKLRLLAWYYRLCLLAWYYRLCLLAWYYRLCFLHSCLILVSQIVSTLLSSPFNTASFDFVILSPHNTTKLDNVTGILCTLQQSGIQFRTNEIVT